MKSRLTVLIVLLLSLAGTEARADEGRLFSSDCLTSTLTTCAEQDRTGYIWIGTQHGLNRFDGYRFTPYLNIAGDERSLCHNNVATLFVDGGGTLWVGTAGGLARYNEARDDFDRIDLLPDNDDEPRITSISQTPDSSIFVGTSGYGLYRIADGKTARQVQTFSKGSGTGFYPGVLVDKQGRLWNIGVDEHVYCYSSATDAKPKLLFDCDLSSLRPFRLMQRKGGEVLAIGNNGVAAFCKGSDKPAIRKSTNTVLCGAIEDHAGNILVATSGNGMYVFSNKTKQVEKMHINNRDVDFASTFISTLMEDRQNNLWLGCDRRGLLFKSHGGQLFTNWSIMSQGYKSGSVMTSAVIDDEGRGVWCSVGDGRLFRFDSRGNVAQVLAMPQGLSIVYRDSRGQMWGAVSNMLYRIDEKKGKAQLVHTFKGTFIAALADDRQGRLYIADFSRGVSVLNTATGSVKNYNMGQQGPKGRLCNDWVMALLCDSRGLMWMATSSGLSVLDPKTEAFNTFGWNNQLEGYACVSLAENIDGSIMVGTDRGLFRFDPKKRVVEPHDNGQGLADKHIRAIVCDANGDVWCSTSTGIWHIRKADGQLTGYINENGLREREYTKSIGLKLTDGRIVFGNSDGLVLFNPKEADTHRNFGSVRLTNIFIGNQRVNSQTLSNGEVITEKPICLTDAVSLSYLDNTFAMEFSTFDYADARSISFEYKLNNDRWIRNACGDNRISFTHLQPGTYRLDVRVAGSAGPAKASVFVITIRAPWYRTTLAYTLYVLLLLLFAGYIVWRYLRARRQQLAEEKMQFLINATHDIRTPLTLVLNPLHQLMLRTDNDDDQKSKLALIDHNARRILTLVNQILDIRKIDKMQMKLHCQATDLATFIDNVSKGFVAYAAERDISFTIDKSCRVEVFIDRVQFDKVVQNLLSNAFKFTSDGGSISVGVEMADDKVRLSVTDTGIGLREADIPRLFSRFYQSAVTLVAGKEGTGIGLNLCKMIVEMHHGTIEAHNRTDGQQGSVFSVTLPLGSAHLSADELKQTDEFSAAQPLKTKTKYRILLVDDDKEMTDYIATEMSAYYHFSSCSNGKEALHELLTTKKPYDLVVSDIMMPEMDGFMLLRTIKANVQLCHLPVILLTSEAAVANRLEGLQRGADAFLAKPFVIEELRMQIDNILARVQRMEQKFSGAEQERKDQVEQRDVDDNDKKLMDRIMQSVNKNLSNSDFTVEQLADDAGLSRSQLHRKMKELTGISPSDFIRNLRLEQGARLLRERKVNVSQVAYSIGFNSLGNFSKAFKHHFGMSPTEYAAK